MSLLDFLKKKKKAEKAKESTVGKETKKAAKEESIKEISFEGAGGEAVHILKRPLVTEKATLLSSENKYTFEVYGNANKSEVKKAIENLYNVKVSVVNILNMPGKKRRVGRTIGKQSGFKKAIITLQKGQKIDILSQ